MNNLHDDLIDTRPGSDPNSEPADLGRAPKEAGRRVEAGTTLKAGLAGIVAGAAALAFGELVASSIAPVPGPVIAVANRVVDNAPTWFVDFGKAVFGLADKPALVVGTVLISLIIAAGLGIRSLAGPTVARAGFAFFGLIGFVAIGTDAQGGWVSGFIISMLAAGLGTTLLGALIGLVVGDATPTANATTATGAGAGAAAGGPPGRPTALIPTPVNPPVSRRGFLNVAGVAGVAAAVAATGARELRARSSASKARDEVEFTAPVEELNELEQRIAAANAGPVGSTQDISPIVVPNDDFYLIDTALTTPQVDPANWSLTIRGLVDNELTVSYDELLDRAETVAPVTLSCVSNEVGGGLVGNAVWRGVPLVELLEEAGVQPGATQIASRSVDGWSCGFPTEAAFDGRTALVAIGMNDEPLPLKHGFPARLVVSGLYGYVSATKWLKEIELTTLEDFNGYWIPRGWSKLGPVKTQSRIDTPRTGQRFEVGETIPIAGVAWAPNSGVSKVEVQIDDGPWQEATLGESLGTDAWIQWLLPWQATAGIHIFQVRATDGTGETQTSVRTPVAPNGASGWHAVGVEVV